MGHLQENAFPLAAHCRKRKGGKREIAASWQVVGKGSIQFVTLRIVKNSSQNDTDDSE